MKICIYCRPCVFCIVFIHFFSASHSMSLSEALPTIAMTLYGSLHAEALQATVSEGLAQGPYAAARVGFEPATLQSKGSDSTNAPPCIYVCSMNESVNVCMRVQAHKQAHIIQLYVYTCIQYVHVAYVFMSLY